MGKHLADNKSKHLKKKDSHVKKETDNVKNACSCSEEHDHIESSCHEHEHKHEHEHGHKHSHGGGCSCHEHEHEAGLKDLIMVVAAAVLFVAAFFLPTNGVVRMLTFLIPYLIVGAGVLKEAAEKLMHGELLEEDFLMSIASIGAFCIGEHPEGVMVMLLYRIGELFEAYALGKSRKSIAELMDIRPDKANVETEAGIISMAPEKVEVGSVMLVSPGERIALDGEIIDGMTSIDTSALTGESMPEVYSVGSKVLSGCINISSPIRVRVTSGYSESTVSRVLELVEGATANKSRHESFITRFSRVYTPIVVLIALVLAIIPPIFAGGWAEWIRRALIFLVVSCPCALVISVPLSYFGGIGSASSYGILVKGSNYLETLANTDIMVFDKTGTITEGKISVSDVFAEGVSDNELLDYAATAERYSNHPIAQALKMVGHDIGGDSDNVMQVEEIPGRGVSAFVNGKHVLVGNAALLSERGVSYKTPRRSGAAVHVAVDKKYIGHILVSDKVKEGAFDAIEAIRHEGVNNFVMLTGDVLSVARPIASALNFDMVKAELLPNGKVSAVEYLLATKQDKSMLAFVGDGVNDAPVLARADVGIAMGALGSDAAIEAADIVLMDDDIRKLPIAIKIAKRTVEIVKQNIAFSLAVKLLIMILGVFGKVPIGVAVFGDVGVLIIAILNALRTLSIHGKEKKA